MLLHPLDVTPHYHRSINKEDRSFTGVVTIMVRWGTLVTRR